MTDMKWLHTFLSLVLEKNRKVASDTEIASSAEEGIKGFTEDQIKRFGDLYCHSLEFIGSKGECLVPDFYEEMTLSHFSEDYHQPLIMSLIRMDEVEVVQPGLTVRIKERTCLN